MENKNNSQEIMIGGLCGVLGTLSYLLISAINLPPTIGFALAMAFPILVIAFSFILYKYIAIFKQSISNQLAFIFICIAFILLSVMLSSQIAVITGMNENIAKASTSEKDMLLHILRSLRWIDKGIDLAWDMYIGVGLLLLSNAIKNHPKFGLWWSIPLAILSILVIVINLIAYPHPPDTVGLIDVGPFIGIFMIGISVRLMVIGFKMKKIQ